MAMAGYTSSPSLPLHLVTNLLGHAKVMVVDLTGSQPPRRQASRHTCEGLFHLCPFM